MQKIKKEIMLNEASCHVFSRYEEPVTTVEPGETVLIHTQDAWGLYDETISEDDLPSTVMKDPDKVNPQTGPIFVEGAEPGDTLAVEIIDIEPARDWAFSALMPNFGGLTTTHDTRLLHDPLPEKLWIYKRDENGNYTNTKNPNLSFEFEPFLGTIATAPKFEAITSLAPFDHGGNMDCPDVKPGNKVYLPVSVPGAYFYTGDAHAKQGEGELCGVALEISAKVTLKIDLIKGKSIKWPRIESPDEIMTVGSTRPMEDAARIAYAELIEWMHELGWDKLEAYQALTQAGKLYCANMVDPNYSMVAKINKKYLHYDGEKYI